MTGSPQSHEVEVLKNEVQLWNQAWTRMIGLMTRVTSFPPGFPQSPEEQRRVAEDLCNSVCRVASDPAQTPAYQALLAKHARCKEKLNKEREKNQVIADQLVRDHQIHEERMRELQNRLEAVTRRAEEMQQTLSQIASSKPKKAAIESRSDSPAEQFSCTINVAKRSPRGNSPRKRPRKMTAQDISDDLKLVAKAVSEAVAKREQIRRESPKRRLSESPRKVPTAHRRFWRDDEEFP
jgi:hypothetical protein